MSAVSDGLTLVELRCGPCSAKYPDRAPRALILANVDAAGEVYLYWTGRRSAPDAAGKRMTALPDVAITGRVVHLRCESCNAGPMPKRRSKLKTLAAETARQGRDHALIRF